MRCAVGARGSRLSMAQTNQVISQLRGAGNHEYEVKAITTRGDTDSRPLFAIDQKGIFEKEIDRAVAQGEVDFAVHSLKDVPSRLEPGLVLASVPKRGPANDVLVSPDGSTLESVGAGAVIGTSSLRRAVQIMRSRPDVRVRPIRGNIETRIGKIPDPYDAIVLAEAGLLRLGTGASYAVLPVDSFVPSPGQGAIALVARAGDDRIISMLQGIEDADSRAETEAERALSDSVDSGCRFPLGAYARSDGDTMTMSAVAFSADGKQCVHAVRAGPKCDPESLGRSVGEDLVGQGVNNLALNWREQVEEWNR